MKKERKGKKVEYPAKWKKYDGPNDNTWEPANSLDGATDIVINFEENLKIVEKSLPSIAVPETEKVYEVEKILPSDQPTSELDPLVTFEEKAETAQAAEQEKPEAPRTKEMEAWQEVLKEATSKSPPDRNYL